MTDLSKDQKIALNKLIDWFKNSDKEQFITLGGYAGTGKTTLISLFRKSLEKENKSVSVAFCSFTGKATRVLKNKIIENQSQFKNDSIGTIHSLIYSPVTNSKEEIVGWERRKEIKADLIIIDEASMIDYEIWKDLISYQIPIMAVGDHGQLPPIKGNFSLMQNPEIKLEEIHRQAKENPIISLSILAREEGKIPVNYYGYNVQKIKKGSIESQEIIGELLQTYSPETLLLCGYNTTRIKLNKYIRSILEFENPEPYVNDRVICLRNNHSKEIFNGMLGTVKFITEEDENWFYAEIQMDGEENVFKGLISKKQFNNPESLNFTEKRAEIMKGDLFDFGYALTVHKAQGSQSKRVILFEERFSKMDDSTWKRWLYTGITRAESELFIVGE